MPLALQRSPESQVLPGWQQLWPAAPHGPGTAPAQVPPTQRRFTPQVLPGWQQAWPRLPQAGRMMGVGLGLMITGRAMASVWGAAFSTQPKPARAANRKRISRIWGLEHRTRRDMGSPFRGPGPLSRAGSGRFGRRRSAGVRFGLSDCHWQRVSRGWASRLRRKVPISSPELKVTVSFNEPPFTWPR